MTQTSLRMQQIATTTSRKEQQMKPYFFNYRVGNHTHAGEFWSSGKQYVEAMIKRVHPDAYRIVVWRV
jgi:hypothetical protein